jgi:hypothetical protein
MPGFDHSVSFYVGHTTESMEKQLTVGARDERHFVVLPEASRSHDSSRNFERPGLQSVYPVDDEKVSSILRGSDPASTDTEPEGRKRQYAAARRKLVLDAERADDLTYLEYLEADRIDEAPSASMIHGKAAKIDVQPGEQRPRRVAYHDD